MKKPFYMTVAACALCMGAVVLPCGTVRAQEIGSLYYYPVSAEEYRNNYHEWRVFLEYNLHREQCQNYQPPPTGFVMRGCDLYRVERAMPAAAPAAKVTVTETRTETVQPQPPLESVYTIYFDFDKSSIGEDGARILEKAAQDIQKYNPSEVTVSGYAARSGPADYNQRLSERRAQSTSSALAELGVRTDVIHQFAYGETHLAVPTADGVRMPANRRAVISFTH